MMKKMFLSLLGLVFINISVLAQEFVGKVVYTKIVDPSAMISGVTMNSQSIKYILVVDGKESSFKADPKQDMAENSSGFSGRRTWRQPIPKDETYYNLGDNTFKRYEEYATQPFQISGEPEAIKWKINPLAQRPILGYNSMMATAEQSERVVIPSWDEKGNFKMKDTVIINKITAWFTDEISSSGGPDQFNGLPGLILALDINNGATTFVATAVEPGEIKKKDLNINKKGKKVTQEKFQQIKDDYITEQSKSSRGGGLPPPPRPAKG